MNKAKLAITKYQGQFTGDQGDLVKYQYVEIEFAPNTFGKFKLNEANLRALQKYNPDMYQLIMNLPEGSPVEFVQVAKTPNGIQSIYSSQEEENSL